MYAPLDFCKKMDISLTKPDTDLGRILRLLTETPDEVIKFLHTDSQFLNQNYNGRYVKLNQFVRKKRSEFKKNAETGRPFGNRRNESLHLRFFHDIFDC